MIAASFVIAPNWKQPKVTVLRLVKTPWSVQSRQRDPTMKRAVDSAEAGLRGRVSCGVPFTCHPRLPHSYNTQSLCLTPVTNGEGKAGCWRRHSPGVAGGGTSLVKP